MQDILDKINKNYDGQAELDTLKEDLKQYLLSNTQNDYHDMFKYNGREWVLDDLCITYDLERNKPLIYIVCKGLSKKTIGGLTQYKLYCFFDEWYKGRLPFYVRDKDDYCFLNDTIDNNLIDVRVKKGADK